jgi:hypothetical protein
VLLALVGLACACLMPDSPGTARTATTDLRRSVDRLEAAHLPLMAFPAAGDETTTEAAGEVVPANFAVYDMPAPSPESLGEEQEVTAPYAPEEEPRVVLEADWGSQPVKQWDRSEYERLAGYVGREVDYAPAGIVTSPARPLAIEELLAANREATHIFYQQAGEAESIVPSRPPVLRALPPGDIQIESADFLDYDEERNMIYGHGRIVARYGPNILKADRVMVDTRLKEVQAYGRVILTNDTDYIEAESMWLNAENGQGVAYKVRGRQGPFYFLGDPTRGDGTTFFRQVSPKESVFKDASFTMCDFPVPHYRIKASEFVVIRGERIFARNAVLYIREIPVLWLPYYTRSLRDGFPWGARVGNDSELGYFARVWYNYYQAYYTPSDDDDNTMDRTTYAHARLFVDFLSKRGTGQGIDYGYTFNNGRHRGHLNAYRIDDSERTINGESDSDRFYANWFHRTEITENLSWLVDVDYPSDPDIFYDILDRLRDPADLKRERIVERSLATGLEWTGEDWFAGLKVEIQDRIGRNRVTNYADPRDDDFDYDRRYNDEQFFTALAPGVGPGGVFYGTPGIYTDETSLAGEIDRGLSTDRYGRVVEKAPHIRVSSNRMRLWTLPLWYHVDINIFNSLDKGLNTVDTRDDAFVRGFDVYQSLSHLLKFSERYTLLTKVGLGFGMAEREDDSYNLEFPAGATFPFVHGGQLIEGTGVVGGLVFTDPETFLVGTKEKRLSDVEPFFVYGDIDSKFNARITDALTAFVRYRMREGTDDDLGHFYEAIGNRKAKDEIYAFRTREHWIEAGLNYSLLYPRLNASLTAGQNLQGREDHTPHELLRYANLALSWSNLSNTLFVNSGLGLQERQMRDPSDPNEYQQHSLSYYAASSYMPVHQRWYARVGAYFVSNQNDDPLYGSAGSRDFDTREEAVYNVSVGRKIGNKYLVEYSSRYRTREDSEVDHFIKVERDFHDLIGTVRLGVKGERLSDKDEDEQREDNLQIKFDFRFKPASDKGVPPYLRTADLFSAGKVGAFETGG